VEAGAEISGLYDPMIAKLVVHDVDREHARRRMLRALEEFEIGGLTTLVGFHLALLEHPCFVDGATCHGVVESEQLAKRASELSEQLSQRTTTVAWAPDGAGAPAAALRALTAEVDGRRYDVKLRVPEPPHAELARRRREREQSAGSHGAARDAVVTPMQGTVLAVEVAEGDEVKAGQVLCVVEAMKMENELTAHRAGVVTELSIEAGQSVSSGQVICVIRQEGDAAE
jgi:acetyl-CoA/propionyl-CoA carboxylase biotin carboxyl carrier protein